MKNEDRVGLPDIDALKAVMTPEHGTRSFFVTCAGWEETTECDLPENRILIIRHHGRFKEAALA